MLKKLCLLLVLCVCLPAVSQQKSLSQMEYQLLLSVDNWIAQSEALTEDLKNARIEAAESQKKVERLESSLQDILTSYTSLKQNYEIQKQSLRKSKAYVLMGIILIILFIAIRIVCMLLLAKGIKLPEWLNILI